MALLRGLHRPNEKLAELMIVAPAARELGATQLTLVCPYLAYMRQDMAFQPGEAVSQRHVGQALAGWFDSVITVDPHLHRVATMDEVLPGRRGVALSAAALLGAWAARHASRPILLGPDEEAAPWVRSAALAQGLEHGTCIKQRSGDREVRVALPDLPFQGREVVLIDDVASTGRTLAVTAARAAAARCRGRGRGRDPCAVRRRRHRPAGRCRRAPCLEQRQRAARQQRGLAGAAAGRRAARLNPKPPPVEN